MTVAIHVDVPATQGMPVHRTGSYRAWSIGAQGGGLADLAWYSRVDHGRPETHRLLPYIEPSISLRRKFDQNDKTLSARLVVCPARPDGGKYAPQPGEEQFALRLSPERIDQLFGKGGAERLTHDGALPQALADLLAPVLRLVDEGEFGVAWGEMLHACEAFAEQFEARQDRVEYAARLSRTSNGQLDPAQLARLADISPRHLRRCFVERFGLTPKGVSRRLRLTSALLEAECQDKPQWAKIAAGNGFSDQAHMIRECRAILGESPCELHRLRRPMAVSFNT